MPRWLHQSPVNQGDPLPTGSGGTVVTGAGSTIDPAVYDAIVRRTVDMIYRICLAVLHDVDAADDATGDVLEKLVKRLPKADVQDVDRWLGSVARTTAIDHLRAIRRRGQVDVDGAAAVHDRSPTPEELAMDEALRQFVSDNLSILTPDQRRVVELRLDGLSAKQIATLLDREPGWVDTTYFRAIRKLRERVDVAWRGEHGR